MTAPPIDTDLGHAVPELGRIDTQVAAGSWAGYASEITGVAARDDELVSWCVMQAGRHSGIRALLDRAEAEQPGDRLVRLTRASERIQTGWGIRGGGDGDTVGRDAHQSFQDHLTQAEQLLIRLTAENPGDTAAWHLRLISGRGLELGPSETRRRYDRLAAANPHHTNAQSQLLQSLCEKWGGSADAMFTFARECAAAGVGTNSPALIANAHLEHRHRLGEPAGPTHLASAEVQNELRRAASDSVWHPDYSPGAGWVAAHSSFAVAFALSDAQADAARHWQALGPHLDDLYVGYFPKQRAQIEKSRERALAGGPR